MFQHVPKPQYIEDDCSCWCPFCGRCGCTTVGWTIWQNWCKVCLSNYFCLNQTISFAMIWKWLGDLWFGWNAFVGETPWKRQDIFLLNPHWTRRVIDTFQWYTVNPYYRIVKHWISYGYIYIYNYIHTYIIYIYVYIYIYMDISDPLHIIFVVIQTL